MNITRRQFLKTTAIAGAGMMLPLKFGVRSAHAFYVSPGLPMWMTTLRGVGPGGIPVVATDGTALKTGATHATIQIRQFTDQLHPNLDPTTLWGFHPVNPLNDPLQAPAHLGGIIVVNRDQPLQLTFRNLLTSNGLPGGTPLRGIIPVDTSIPGANAAQNRTAVHLHGGLVPWISDGGPFDWWAPNGTHGLSFLNNQVLNPGAALNEGEYYYPNRQSARLVWYHDHAFGYTRCNAYAGVASGYIIRDTFESNMKLAGLPPFIEESILVLHEPPRELPIVIQDKTFVGSNIGASDPTWVQKGLPSTPGSLWYPHIYEKNRWRLLGAGTRLPNPSVVAEAFGDTMLVNGTVYPQIDVQARRYRFRVLNACNARFLNLQLLIDDGTPDGVTIAGGVATNAAGPGWLVLGTEAGFLAKPVPVPSKVPFGLDANGSPVGSLVTGNAERWDVLVDFTGLAGQSVILYSDAPAPFPFGDDRNDFYFGNTLNPASSTTEGSGPDTRVLMKFNVLAGGADPALALTDANGDWVTGLPGIDPFLVPIANIQNGTWPAYVSQNYGITQPRRITLNEQFDGYGRLAQIIGTDVAYTPGKFGRPFLSPVTENPARNTVEVWEIVNLTGDTHPIHFHLVNVQILDRHVFDVINYNGGAPLLIGNPIPPDASELGWKETVKMHPGQVIRVIMKFDLVPTVITNPAHTPINLTSVGGDINGNPPPSPRTGGMEYAYHCHILEHEEHDMMRPLVVT